MLPAALAWGNHYAVTDRALNHPRVDYADHVVTVEPLDDFLVAEADAVARVFADYYTWLEVRGSTRFNRQAFDTAAPTVDSFIRAARMNPEQTTFALAYRVPPGRDGLGQRVPAEEVSPKLSLVRDPLTRDLDLLEVGQQVPARAVLTTFSDEPDWGFDHELWGYTDYGFGEQPYGKPTGESSKAPFHMQFNHENFLVRISAPEVLDGMAVERMELFLRLSRCAFETGHDYWGYRFAAWSIHYAQDLAQPYHSKAVPVAGPMWYVRYLLSSKKDKIKTETTQVEANRHFLHEDYVAFGLQQSYLTDLERYQALSAFLSGGDLVWEGADSAEALGGAIMAESADHSKVIDRTVAKAYGPRMTEDPTYDVETAEDYSVAEALSTMDPKAGEKLLDETGEDFDRAGRATRTIVALARGE